MTKHLLPAVQLFLATFATAETFRPAYHFTPERNWMNDPNGMVYFDGEYHLFYQYNPFGEKWGHMSWGHAVSRDMVAWEELPVALPEKDGIMIFSGSAVVDWNHTSGFGKDGKPPLVAIYTGHRQGRQDQRIAFSNDRGRTWTQYDGNPVLDVNKPDFRDPKVIWHEGTRRWVMAVTLSTEKKISFYGSSDLKSWKHLSDFGPSGALGGIWECPDLFELPVENKSGQSKWVLLLNMNPGAPAGGSGCQYFVGHFDGTRFELDPSHPAARPQVRSEARVLAGFEDEDWGVWKAEGSAFGNAPSRPDPVAITGFEGLGLANSFGGGDENQGILISPVFPINSEWISFRIGGGRHPGEVGIRLRVDGEIMREETGNHSPHLEEKSWDVRALRGKEATLEIFDEHSGTDWGHTIVDHIASGSGPRPFSGSQTLWADFGADYYATVTWSDVPKEDGRRLAIGWMSNWEYAEAVPTSPFRGAMTLPREITLRHTPDGYRLIQQPVKELAKLRTPETRTFSGGSFAEASAWLAEQGNLPELLEVSINFEDVGTESLFSFSFQTSDDEETKVGLDGGRVFMDRTRSGQTNFHPKFAARHEAPVRIADGKLDFRMFLDRSSIELFAADGKISFTNLIFPSPGERKLKLTGAGTPPAVRQIVIHPLKPGR